MKKFVDMVDDFVAQDKNLRLAELRFKASRGNVEAAATLKKDLIDRKALPFYQLVATELVRFSLFFGCVSCISTA